MELSNNDFVQEIALDYVENELEYRKRIFKDQLKKLSEEDLRNAVVNIDINNWKYDLLKNEVKRRYLLNI